MSMDSDWDNLENASGLMTALELTDTLDEMKERWDSDWFQRVLADVKKSDFAGYNRVLKKKEVLKEKLL